MIQWTSATCTGLSDTVQDLGENQVLLQQQLEVPDCREPACPACTAKTLRDKQAQAPTRAMNGGLLPHQLQQYPILGSP